MLCARGFTFSIRTCETSMQGFKGYDQGFGASAVLKSLCRGNRYDQLTNDSFWSVLDHVITASFGSNARSAAASEPSVRGQSV